MEIFSAPSQPSASEMEEKWYSPTAPMGGRSAMLRIIWHFQFPEALQPFSKRYVSPGGFQLAHSLDVDQVMVAFAYEVFKNPHFKIGTQVKAIGWQGEALPTDELERVVAIKEKLLYCARRGSIIEPPLPVNFPASYAVQPDSRCKLSALTVVRGRPTAPAIAGMCLKQGTAQAWARVWSKTTVQPPADHTHLYLSSELFQANFHDYPGKIRLHPEGGYVTLFEQSRPRSTLQWISISRAVVNPEGTVQSPVDSRLPSEDEETLVAPTEGEPIPGPLQPSGVDGESSDSDESSSDSVFKW